MFSLAPAEWEENFQDLSGWCVAPPCLNATDRYAAPTDELNTPIIALETEGFHFNPNLARREPKFVDESNKWGVTPSEEKEPSSYTSLGIVPDTVVESYSPSIISPGSAASNATMAWEDSEFVSGYYEGKANFFISDINQDDFMKSDCSAPLALVEGKIRDDDFEAGLANTKGNEINTPDIVRMIIDFPVKNEKHLEIAPINIHNGPTAAGEDLGHSIDEFLLPEIEGGFDLLAYIDDSPKISAAGTASPSRHSIENIKHEECDPGFEQPPAPSKIIDTQANAYITFQLAPSITETTSILSPKAVVVKEESSSDEEVNEEDETYEPYKPTKGRKRVRRVTNKEPEFILPLKRGRRSTSTCSELTTASTSSDNKYRELRDRNNEASKRSRQSRKMRDGEMSSECSRMEKENAALKIKADEMERLVKQLRQALLTAVTNKKKKI